MPDAPTTGALLQGSPAASRAAAFHEAGQAVAAVALGVPFQRVSIRRDDPSLGYALLGEVGTSADWYLNHDREARDLIENRIVAAFAGGEAERLVPREYGPADQRAFATSERVRSVFDSLTPGLGAEGVRNYQQFVRERARAVINGALNRRAIDAVAAALSERHRLTAADVVQLVGDCKKNVGA